eukprot:gene32438-43338_t
MEYRAFIATAAAPAEAKALCSFSPIPSLKCSLRRCARHHVPGHQQAADQRPWQARAGAPPGEG